MKKKNVKTVDRDNVSKVHKLRTKLILAFMLPTLLFVFTGILTYSVSSVTLTETYENSTIASVATLSDYYSMALNNIELMAARLSVNADIDNYYSGGVGSKNLTVEDIKYAINNEAIADRYVAHITILSPNGKCCCEKGKLSGEAYEEFINSQEAQIVIQEGERAKCWLSSHPSLDAVTGTKPDAYAMSFVHTILNSGRKITGYIVIDVRKDFIVDILANAKISPGSQEVLILSDGTQIEADTGKIKFTEQDFFQKVMEQSEEKGFSYVTANGIEKLFAYQKFGSGMVMCALVPKKEMLTGVRTVMYITILAILLCVIVSVVVGTVISQNISKALQSVNGVLKLTSEGDLTGQVSVKRKDEFATLGSNLTETIRSMKDLIRKMTHVSHDVSGSAEAVNSNSQSLMNVMEHISHAVDEINNGIVQQVTDTQSCVAQMNELADKITQVHERTDRMNSLAAETKNAVEDGTHRVHDLESKVEESTLCTQEIVKEIEALNQASEDISSIIVTMNSIAEETNLLSLNASIEAARAGDAGKGFAVVSEEIRKLAEQSTQAGTRIGEIILEVQTRVGTTMETALKADSIVDAQIQALSNTITIFNEISKRVMEIESGVTHILHSIDRIEVAKVDTLSSIESISSTVHETEEASSELGTGAEQLIETANQLNEAVQMLRENATDLDSSVNVFKI